MARPQLEIDEDTVEKLAAIHCTMQEIASVVGCSVDTLERRFADTIKVGKDKGKTSLRRYQWKAAEKGNVSMLIWLGKQLLGQKDKSDSEIEALKASGQGPKYSDSEILKLIKSAAGDK
jgi:hypothetical protein